MASPLPLGKTLIGISKRLWQNLLVAFLLVFLAQIFISLGQVGLLLVSSSNEYFALGAPLLLYLLVSCFYMGALYALIKGASFTSSFTLGFRKWPYALALGILWLIAISLSVMLLVIPVLIVGPLLFVAFGVLAAEDKDPIACIKESTRLTRHHLWQVFLLSMLALLAIMISLPFVATPLILLENILPDFTGTENDLVQILFKAPSDILALLILLAFQAEVYVRLRKHKDLTLADNEAYAELDNLKLS